MTPKTTVVIDLDGTLANIDHRLHLIKREKPDWDEFYRRVHKDTINKWCFNLINGMTLQGLQVVIVSGRANWTRYETEKWLRDNNVDPDIVKLFLLRKDHDFTPDQELKLNWLKRFGKRKILFVVDDRQRVVDMWREQGLVCLQCYAWPEYKKTKDILETGNGKDTDQ